MENSIKFCLLCLVLAFTASCSNARNMDDPALSNPEPRSTDDTMGTDSSSTLSDSTQYR